MTERAFLVQPGGKFREAIDGGLIIPVHLDAAFATEFLEHWRTEGITFALAPLTDASNPAASEGGGQVPPPLHTQEKRKRSPAEFFHLEDCYDTDFQAWCGATDADGAHAAIRATLGLDSLSTLTQPQVNAIRLFWRRGGMLPGLPAHLTNKGLL